MINTQELTRSEKAGQREKRPGLYKDDCGRVCVCIHFTPQDGNVLKAEPWPRKTPPWGVGASPTSGGIVGESPPVV
jgi:hypothetical protein